MKVTSIYFTYYILFASNLIPLLGLFQEFSNVSDTLTLTVFKFFCDLSLCDIVCFYGFLNIASKGNIVSKEILKIKE